MDETLADAGWSCSARTARPRNSTTRKPIASSTSFADDVPSGRPLIAGTGRESTRATIAATRRAAAAGVDAVLVRTPSFFKSQMTTDVFVRHYTEVADASPFPCCSTT